MRELYEYIVDHTTTTPDGIDMIFFSVGIRDNPTSEALHKLISDHKEGEFADVDLFDGKEHSYFEIGAWIGDQGTALLLMALGDHLGLWKRLTPRSVLGDIPGDAMVRQMAGMGMISIIHRCECEEVPDGADKS